jgi:hypothetical protein
LDSTGFATWPGRQPINGNLFGKEKKMRTARVLLIVSLLLELTSFGYAQGGAESFTWSGVIMDAGVPLAGDYDLLFRLYDASEGGRQIGTDVVKSGSTLSNGFFWGALHVGVDIYDGSTRWLEIAYKPAGVAGPYRVLWAPREEVRRTHDEIIAETAELHRALAVLGPVGIGTVSPKRDLHICDPADGSATLRLEGNRSAAGWANVIDLVAPASPAGPNRRHFRIIHANPGTAEGENTLEFRSMNDDESNRETWILGLSHSGNVGIGRPPTDFRLAVGGDILCASLHETSDRHLKANVTRLTKVLDRVEKIRGVSFEWSKEAESLGVQAGRKQIGIVAQEMEPVFPELVSTGSDGYKSVDYSKLTAVLLEAIKELKAENESLSSRLQALELSLSSD